MIIKRTTVLVVLGPYLDGITVEYKLLAHRIYPADDFVTIHRAGEFIHHTLWSDPERALASEFLAFAVANPDGPRTIYAGGSS